MIENPRTGEQIDFVVRAPELLVMASTWTRGGRRAAEHLHPTMQERFEVIEGRAAFLVDGERRDSGPGTVVVVEPGQRHLAWNPTNAPVRVRIEMRPALRWAKFTERLFAGAEPAGLLEEFAAEIRLP